MWYFYVLQSQKTNNYFYKGSTNDLRRRFSQHQSGEVTASAPHKPFKLVYYEAYTNEKAARARESCVKKSGSSWGSLMTRIKKYLKYELPI
ncbi:GIY-YIG nuclease family protein [Patescibacteria group bacterium]|nr:GIY-YIG nuclease family protein [Patescibacteria group bacterium]MBU1122994.1 GIY-YIG nuclease family protein [Patescibacteria group bacterium]MBU1911667.1 GIY-YIG nuclease family protein [Patescibacteria group bacterium]